MWTGLSLYEMTVNGGEIPYSRVCGSPRLHLLFYLRKLQSPLHEHARAFERFVRCTCCYCCCTAKQATISMRCAKKMFSLR